MSSDGKDKPFEPTQHKLDEARRRGEVPQSKDFPVVASLGAAAGAVALLVDWLAQTGQALLTGLLLFALGVPGQEPQPLPALKLVAWEVFKFSTAVLLAAGLAGTLVKWLLTGPVFSFKPVTPDIKRINPVQGFKRVFSGETWVALFKSIVCAGVIGGTLWAWAVSLAPRVLLPMTPMESLRVACLVVVREVAIGCAVLAVFALLDVMYQRWTFRRKMRMDHKDLRDEHKQQEGSPEVKGERQQEHRRLLS